MRRGLGASLGCVLLAAACRPSFDERDSEVRGPRVLAVAVSPPEAVPGESVTATALFVDGDGPRLDVSGSWDFCVARKPLAEVGSVALRCLGDDEGALAPVGAGQSVVGALPKEGCKLFGPELPPPVAGEPAGRPVDPDASGGFHQPIRLAFGVSTGRELAFGAARLVCTRGGLTQETAAELARRSRRNAAIVPELLIGGVSVPDGGERVATSGGVVPLEVRWPACPTSDVCGDGICGVDEDAKGCPADCAVPKGCGGAERYVVPSADGASIIVRREAVQVAWFSTRGTFAADRTGTAADDGATATANTLTLADGDHAWIWVVARDDRGAVSWTSARVSAGP